MSAPVAGPTSAVITPGVSPKSAANIKSNAKKSMAAAKLLRDDAELIKKARVELNSIKNNLSNTGTDPSTDRLSHQLYAKKLRDILIDSNVALCIQAYVLENNEIPDPDSDIVKNCVYKEAAKTGFFKGGVSLANRLRPQGLKLQNLQRPPPSTPGDAWDLYSRRRAERERLRNPNSTPSNPPPPPPGGTPSPPPPGGTPPPPPPSGTPPPPPPSGSSNTATQVNEVIEILGKIEPTGDIDTSYKNNYIKYAREYLTTLDLSSITTLLEYVGKTDISFIFSSDNAPQDIHESIINMNNAIMDIMAKDSNIAVGGRRRTQKRTRKRKSKRSRTSRR